MTRKEEKDVLLIVDDNPTNLGVLFDYLRNSDFKVLVAEDGEGALARASYAKPDIILLDVVMSGTDGFETCRRLKENEETKDIPVIFMTALADTIDKVKGFEVGAVDYITKPLHHEEVLARITTHLTIRKLQKNLQEQIDERDKLIEELDAFAHTVAHDLKGPLGSIIGYIDFLETDEGKTSVEKQKELLKFIGRTAQKMNTIIQELLLLASVRKGKMKTKSLDMAQIVTEARSRLSFMTEEYKAVFTVPEEWPVAMGYPSWVEEIWVNYISNAIKYGGKLPHVELGATVQEDGMIRFWVQDNGPGLTPEEQKKLFVPFTRLDQVRAEGHGLGLSIVQRIAERLGGNVGVESTVGQGSRFFFTLPNQTNSNQA